MLVRIGSKFSDLNLLVKFTNPDGALLQEGLCLDSRNQTETANKSRKNTFDGVSLAMTRDSQYGSALVYFSCSDLQLEGLFEILEET